MQQSTGMNKKQFGAGVVVGIGALFVIGFFILLSMVMNGNSLAQDRQVGAESDTRVAAPTPPSGAMGGHDVRDGAGSQLSPVSDQDWIRGNRNAPISIVEFSDYDCPFCARFHPTAQRAVDEYDGQVNWVFRHFPLSIHPTAEIKAQAAECAGAQGGNEAFWEYTDLLFERQSRVQASASGLASLGGELGLDTQILESCISSSTHTAKLRSQYNDALASGGRGTPHTIIVSDNQHIPLSGAVPYTQIRTLIDSLL